MFSHVEEESEGPKMLPPATQRKASQMLTLREHVTKISVTSTLFVVQKKQ